MEPFAYLKGERTVDGHTRQRSNVGRVAIPVEPKPAPAQASPADAEVTPITDENNSLVPSDVWETWQRELQLSADEDDSDGILEVDDADVQPVLSAETSLGLGATTPADFEVALFALGQVKLFSKLDRAALETLAASARQGELESGGYLFREDAFAESFYVVLDGALEVLRRSEGREVALRHIDRTEPVGLFGVLSGQRRAACVRAIGDAVLLEIPASVLNEAMEKHPELSERVGRFYQERLLEGFIGSSKLFADVDSIARARLIGRFVPRKLNAGETLAQPGEVSNLLAVVISGKVHLESRARPGEVPTMFDLVPGEFLALTSAFSGAPCRMKVFAEERTVLALMGHKELAELLRDYPALRGINLRLPQVAQALTRDVWCGHTAVPGL